MNIQMYNDTAQKMKFSIKDFFSKCHQIRGKLRIWPHLLKKSLMKNFIFCAVWITRNTRRAFNVLILSDRKIQLKAALV